MYKTIIPVVCFFAFSCTNSSKHKNTKMKLEEKAENEYKADNYEKAIKLYDTILTIDSNRGDLYYKRGYSFMMLKSSSSQNAEFFFEQRRNNDLMAINNFLKSIQLGYKKSDSYLNLGAIYAFINDSIVLQYLSKGLSEDPNNKKLKHEKQLCEERIKTNNHFYLPDSNTY